MGLMSWLRSLFSPPPPERRRLLLDPALLDEAKHAPPDHTIPEGPCPNEGHDAVPCDDSPSWDDAPSWDDTPTD
ncbi:MAG: hypothetical protein RMK67_02570 [Chloroflexota bacterium]|nr:hypothetical protein [Chloroflexota bacterium]